MRRASQAIVLVAAALAVGAAGLAAAERQIYVPGVKVLLEVRTPKGELRSFHRPGSPPAYWAQDMPAVQGDRVTIVPLVATGGAELGTVKIRLNHEEIASFPKTPQDKVDQTTKVVDRSYLATEVDTAKLAPGYHFVEVWAETRARDPRDNSATITFLLVPETDPLLSVLAGEKSEAALPVTDEERLAASIHARDEQVERQVTETSTAVLAAPVLFFVSAGPGVSEFFYTLSRDGRVTYTSPRLPIQTHIRLAPSPEEGGLAAGEVILTVRAGDGSGRFGPPDWVTLQVKPSTQEEGAK